MSTFGAATRVDVEHEHVDYNSSLVAKWRSMTHRTMCRIFPELEPEYTWIATSESEYTDSDGEEQETTVYGGREAGA